MEKKEYHTIKPNNDFLSFDLKELWMYRDLLRMYIKRDIVTMYKQTILGPLWFIVNPILTTLMFMFVFGNIAKIPTDGIPHALFYMSGIVLWNYFSESLKKNANTFISNSKIFGKVYFPRIVVPVSIVISNLIKLVIQLFILLAIYLYFIGKGVDIKPNVHLLLLPFLVLLLAVLSLGFGLIFSSLTTKYRDLIYLLTFGVTLWQYATPIIYPLSEIPNDKKWIVQLNPITPIVETFKYGLFGEGYFSWMQLLYSLMFSIIIFLIGVLIFNKVQKNFMDTI